MKVSGERLAQLARNVREARISQNLTQEVMAERTGLSVPQYSQIELGNKSPSLNTLIQISEVLNMSLDALVFGVDNRVEAKNTLRLIAKLNDSELAKVNYIIRALISAFKLGRQ